jgi:hypothetical protein
MCLSKPVIQSKFCVRGFTIYNYKNYFYPIQVNSSRPNIMQLLKGNLRHSWSKHLTQIHFLGLGSETKLLTKRWRLRRRSGSVIRPDDVTIRRRRQRHRRVASMFMASRWRRSDAHRHRCRSWWGIWREVMTHTTNSNWIAGRLKSDKNIIF